MIEWARNVRKKNVFVIVIKRSDKGDSRKARVSLACERGGTYRHAKNKSNVEALNRKGTGTKNVIVHLR